MKIKYLFTLLLFLTLSLSINAQSLKVNLSQTVVSLEVKLNKFTQEKDGVKLEGAVKQKKNFSYSLSMENCEIISANEKIYPGQLIVWNDNKKNPSLIQSISDEKAEKFSIYFPGLQLKDCANIELKFGTILDRAKTPIIFKITQLKKSKY